MGEIFGNHIFDKGLVSRMHKEPLQCNIKNQPNFFKMGMGGAPGWLR